VRAAEPVKTDAVGPIGTTDKCALPTHPNAFRQIDIVHIGQVQDCMLTSELTE